MSDRPVPRPREIFVGLKQHGAPLPPADVRMSLNEWPEPTPVARYLSAEELESILLNRYPLGPGLREVLAERWGVAPAQLILGNGSNDVLTQAFLVFGDAGRTALVFTPTYPMHMRLPPIFGMTLADERVGLPYDIDAARVRDAIARHAPHVVVFCSPNNPTGNLVPEDAILAAAEGAPETLVMVDEAYADFAGQDLVPHVARHPNLVIARTFSKARAAAGLRVGALIAHPKLVEVFRSVQLPAAVSALAQAVAVRIVEDEEGVAARVALAARERERIIGGLRAHRDLEVFPSVANFILFRHRSRPAAELQEAILERGLLVRDVSMWPGAERCIRVSLGTPEENVRFLDAVTTALAVPAAAT